MRQWLVVLILGAIAAGEVRASNLNTDKDIYAYDETVVISFANDGDRDLALAVQQPHELLLSDADLRFYKELKPGDAGTWQLPARELFDRWGDVPRLWVSLRLVNPPVVVAQKWILIQRGFASARGTLELPGRDLFSVGESVEVALHGIDALRDANREFEQFEQSEPTLFAELWKAGRVLPGGAHLPDVRGYATYRIPPGATSLTITPDNEPLRDILGYWDVGHYELRLIGLAGAVLDSVQFTVDLPPDSAFAFRLDPPRQGAYDYRTPPYVLLAVEPDVLQAFKTWLRPSLSLCGPDQGGVIVCFADSNGPFLVDTVLRGDPAANAVYVSGGLRPGRYAFILTGRYEFDSVFSHSVLKRLARLGEAAFEIGGDYPPERLPMRPEPRLEFGDVGLRVAEGERVAVGQTLNATISLPGNAAPAARGLFAKVFPADDFGFNCHPLLAGVDYDGLGEDVYQIGELRPDAAGRLSFRAPDEPGRYELRLMEPDSLGDPITVARAFFVTELHSLSGSLQLHGGPAFAWGDPIRITWLLPAGFPRETAEIKVFRSAELLPGGVPRAATGFVDTDVQEGSPYGDSGGGDVTFMATANPGLYEARLVSGAVRLDRLLFEVLPPEGAPQPPPGTGFARAPELDDWPVQDDPRRGLAVWTPAAADCVDPSFPEPPTLRLVERLTGNPEDDADDRYVEVTTPFPGHPYYIEAAFGTAPPEADYRVKLNERLRVVVARTADPRLYRSEAVVVWRASAP